MRVLRTVTIENSAATKNPLANTSAIRPARRHMTSMRTSHWAIAVIESPLVQLDNPIAQLPDYSITRVLGFSIGEEVGVDEVVDERLRGRIDGFKLDTHTDPTIAPRDTAFGIDVAFRSRHAEANLDFCAGVERTGRANGNTAVAQIERQRRRDRVPK